MNCHSNAYLDSVRGLACLMVVLAHTEVFIGVLTSGTAHYSQDSFVWQAYHRLFNGNFAVCIFFVLSGFVLLVNFQASNSHRYLEDGAIKRYFRLTPMALISIILAYVIAKTIGFSANEAGQSVGHSWLSGLHYETSGYSLARALKQGLVGIYYGETDLNSPLWTIGIELWGSLFLFFFMSLFHSSNRLCLISFVACMLLIYSFGDNGVYVALFLGGALILFSKIRLSVLWLPLGFYLGTLYDWAPEVNAARSVLEWFGIHELVKIDVAAHSIGAILLIASVVGTPRIHIALMNPLLQWLGRVSFGIYVTHFILFTSIGTLTLSYFTSLNITKFGAFLGLLLTLSSCAVLSHMLYLKIDLPSQKLASRIAKLVASRNASVA